MTVRGLAGVASLDAGHRHTCAASTGGTVACWGDGGSGQLGNGTPGGQLVPVQVGGLVDVARVTAGPVHTCARLLDGTARCWGGNSAGPAGRRKHVVAIHARRRARARRRHRDHGGLPSLVCGRGGRHGALLGRQQRQGQLGLGIASSSPTPVAVPGLDGATSISAGVVVGQQHVRRSRRRERRLLGPGPGSSVPITVAGVARCRRRGGGPVPRLCAPADRTVTCWGINVQGQLGDGTMLERVGSVQVVGLTDVVAIAAGGSSSWNWSGHTCAIRSGGEVWCWGANADGQLGDGTTQARPSPTVVPGITDAVALAAGQGHSCALRTDQTVACWGSNEAGRLGDGTRTRRLTPVAVVHLADAVSIAAGVGHTCAVLADGSARCWGDAGLGQLGDGATWHERHLPMTVVGLAGAIFDHRRGGPHVCRPGGRVGSLLGMEREWTGR